VDLHVLETIVCILVGMFLLAFVQSRRRRNRGRSRVRDKREMQESIRRFNRRDHNDTWTWRW
jgi:hypothetical protein